MTAPGLVLRLQVDSQLAPYNANRFATADAWPRAWRLGHLALARNLRQDLLAFDRNLIAFRLTQRPEPALPMTGNALNLHPVFLPDWTAQPIALDCNLDELLESSIVVANVCIDLRACRSQIDKIVSPELLCKRLKAVILRDQV